MKHYQEKYDWLWKWQGGNEDKPAKCSCCGEDLIYKPNDKITLAHNLAKTLCSVGDYPLFIHSLLNLSLQYNSHNVARRQPVKDNPLKMWCLWSESQNSEYQEIMNVYQEFYCQGFTYAVAAQMERFLQDNPEFARLSNVAKPEDPQHRSAHPVLGEVTDMIENEIKQYFIDNGIYYESVHNQEGNQVYLRDEIYSLAKKINDKLKIHFA